MQRITESQEPDLGALTLRIQVVLYQTPLEAVARCLTGVKQATRHALKTKAITRFELAVGDCSAVACQSQESITSAWLAGSEPPEAEPTYEFFGENLGSGGGSNRLAAHASTDLLLVLNPDTHLSPLAISELIKVHNQRGAAAVDARQLPLEHPKYYDPATLDTGWASGACMLLSRVAFERVGGFDSKFFPLYCDDVDLSWRLRLDHQKVLHCPSAKVFHDKKLDRKSGVVASDTEVRSGTLARLFLTHRYSAPQIRSETIAYIRKEGSRAHRQALADYETALSHDDIPPPLPRAASVAEFVVGNYARHRF